MTKQKKLRNLEYYNLQSLFDGLYERSKNGDIFNKLMKIIRSEENIKLAYRNIKRNHGSNTPGMDEQDISDIEKRSADRYVQLIQNKLAWYKPKPVGNPKTGREITSARYPNDYRQIGTAMYFTSVGADL